MLSFSSLDSSCSPHWWTTRNPPLPCYNQPTQLFLICLWFIMFCESPGLGSKFLNVRTAQKPVNLRGAASNEYMKRTHSIQHESQHVNHVLCFHVDSGCCLLVYTLGNSAGDSLPSRASVFMTVWWVQMEPCSLWLLIWNRCQMCDRQFIIRH